MRKVIIVLAVFLWGVTVHAQNVQDSQALVQITGQKASEMGNQAMRQSLDQVLAGILDSLGKLGIPGLDSLKELLSEPAEPEVPGVSTEDKKNPEVAKANIQENLQIPDDTSEVEMSQMKTVRNNQSSAEKELGMTGLANAWVYSMNAAQFPNQTSKQNQRIQTAMTEKDMITALSLTTIQLTRDTAILTDIAAQSIQSSAIQYNVGDALSAPDTKDGGTK